MQAAIATSAGPIRGARRHPGWKVWMLMLPMLLWLAAFVVFPTAILSIYSLCERGAPVEYSLTQQNYLRVVAGTKLAPLIPSLLLAGGIAAAAMLVDWFRPSTRSRLEKVRSIQSVGIFAAAIVLLWTIWANLTQVFPGTYVRIFVRSIYYAGFTALVCALVG